MQIPRSPAEDPQCGDTFEVCGVEYVVLLRGETTVSYLYGERVPLAWAGLPKNSALVPLDEWRKMFEGVRFRAFDSIPAQSMTLARAGFTQ